ncbi:phytoene/squalene synthase family protein [Pelagibius sp.]|uniref:phytoene/squalene synthase family protein n=1 Tax=Pelagibius sp. TaxID=1931238 RepID=UPI003BABEEA6
MQQPLPDPDTSAADLAACRQLLSEGSRSFYAASRLLPGDVRDDAIALYAFCRTADDAVDLGQGGLETPAALRARLERLYAGRPEDDAVDRAFAAMVRRRALPRDLPLALVEGLHWDAEGRQYETLADLQAYAARVAGTVGAMMTVVMGVRDADALARACDLGVAMQLTNIARDVGEDARAGRLYLPRQWLREAGIDPDAWLAAPRFCPALASVIARLLAAAERLYARAESGIAALPAGCRPAILAASLIYAEIGVCVAHNGFDSLSQRAVVPGARKLSLMLKSLTRTAGQTVLPRRAALRRALAQPALDQTRFLVCAVAPLPDATAEAAAEAQVVLPWWDLSARVCWMIALFERLERSDREVAATQAVRRA